MSHPAYRGAAAGPGNGRGRGLGAAVQQPRDHDARGTNTWVLRGPGSDEMVVVDPGPDDDEHLGRLADLGHPAGADQSQARRPHRRHRQDRRRHRRPPCGRSAGSCAGSAVHSPTERVIEAATAHHRAGHPGHTADSLSFLVGDAVLTADTVLGRHHRHRRQDGSLTDYLGRCAGHAGARAPGRAAGARTRTRRSAGRQRDVPRAPRGSAWTRSARPCVRSVRTRPRGRSSSTSTPTSTRNSGTPPRSRCAPSWTTCGASGPAWPAARSR